MSKVLAAWVRAYTPNLPAGKEPVAPAFGLLITGQRRRVSLPERQQRALATIDQAIEARDPRLAAMFRIFTRLNADDAVPRHERLVPRQRPRLGLFHPGSSRAGARTAARSSLGASAAALKSFALLACLTAVVAIFAVVSINTPRCAQPPRSSQVAAHRAALCKAPPLPGK
jgi:hypothetical protein